MNNEEKWLECYNLLKEYKETYGDCNVPRRYVTSDGHNLGIWVYTQRKNGRSGNMLPERKVLLDDLGFNYYCKVETWQNYYKLLCEYKDKYDSVDVPGPYITEGGEKLGQWCIMQRYDHGKHKLSEKKAQLLENIGFSLKKKTVQLPWYDWYKMLLEYKKKNGHLDVPVSYITDDGYKLGYWVHNQRVFKRNGNLSPAREELLNKLGITWSFDRKPSIPWEEYFKVLLEYKKEYGNCDVPSTYLTKEGYDLGKWCSTQRSNYRNNRLSESRIKLLEEQGFNLMIEEKKLSWEEYFKLLLEYKEKYGNCDVPKAYVTRDGYNLGNWCYRQRINHQNNKLSNEQIEFLSSINFKLSVKERNSLPWDDWFELLLEYQKKYGHLDVPVSYITEDGYKLGWWLYSQIRAHKGKGKRKFNKEHDDRLTSIGFNWDRDKTNPLPDWINRLENIKIVINEKGYDALSFKQQDWLYKQKIKYRNGELSDLQSEKLKSVVFISSGEIEPPKLPTAQAKNKIARTRSYNNEESRSMSLWNACYDQLYKLYTEYGYNIDNATFVADPKLVSWMRYNRNKYQNYKLERNKVEKYNHIFFDWRPADTKYLNREIVDNLEYKKIMLERMKHILDDLSYEMDGSITDISKQKEIEKKIIKRMWR